LIATGLAKGAAARGKKIAFGSVFKKQLVWDYNSELIFRDNPNIAFPGQERDKNVEWVQYFKGHRQYNRDSGHGNWIWNMEWRCIPGEIYLSSIERDRAKKAGNGFIVLEPNVESWKKSSPNKDWGNRNYAAVATRLIEDGYKIVQFEYPRSGPIVRGATAIRTGSFRDALAIMQRSALYLGPEGGLHHGAAAVGVPAVVLFGGFIPPAVTGYDTHTNLVGSDRFCGQLSRCQHCIDAMASISVDLVYQAVRERLDKRTAVVSA
jgi:ADP-heptose:LPS heptosyltransferase